MVLRGLAAGKWSWFILDFTCEVAALDDILCIMLRGRGGCDYLVFYWGNRLLRPGTQARPSHARWSPL